MITSTETTTTRVWTFAEEEGGRTVWTFAEEEGGRTVVETSAAALTLSRWTGPDCDGTTGETHYEFVQRDPSGPWADGTYVRTGPWRDSVTEVHADNPAAAWWDYVTAELGGLLASSYLLSQPTDA